MKSVLIKEIIEIHGKTAPIMENREIIMFVPVLKKTPVFVQREIVRRQESTEAAAHLSLLEVTVSMTAGIDPI